MGIRLSCLLDWSLCLFFMPGAGVGGGVSGALAGVTFNRNRRDECDTSDPCGLCRIHIHQGTLTFSIVDLIYSVLVVLLNILELMHMFGQIDVDFWYLKPHHHYDTDSNSDEKYDKDVLPTTCLCLIISLSRVSAGIILVVGVFGRSFGLCRTWLWLQHALFFPRVAYVLLAGFIGTSVVALIMQILDTLVCTPYGAWIVRRYMDWLDILRLENNQLVTNSTAQSPDDSIHSSGVMSQTIFLKGANKEVIAVPNPQYFSHVVHLGNDDNENEDTGKHFHRPSDPFE